MRVKRILVEMLGIRARARARVRFVTTARAFMFEAASSSVCA